MKSCAASLPGAGEGGHLPFEPLLSLYFKPLLLGAGWEYALWPLEGAVPHS